MLILGILFSKLNWQILLEIKIFNISNIRCDRQDFEGDTCAICGKDVFLNHISTISGKWRFDWRNDGVCVPLLMIPTTGGVILTLSVCPQLLGSINSTLFLPFKAIHFLFPENEILTQKYTLPISSKKHFFIQISSWGLIINCFLPCN